MTSLRLSTSGRNIPMKTWLEPEPVIVPNDFQQSIGGHTLVSEVLVRRGFDDLDQANAFLDPESYTPASPYELPGMEPGVSRILTAIKRSESILVWGDFDVDGQTATTLLVSTLRDLGGNVTYHIPLRERESHGVNLPVLRQEIEKGLHLILTCDTGISAHEAVDFATSRGVDVIISDHHDPPAALPDALALINPKLRFDDHPLLTLPGVGVAYKLAEALYEQEARLGDAEAHLDLVALGIVADLALQVDDTRYLLQRGLAALQQTGRLGLQRMFELAEIDPAGLNEEHIGFELAPRLNALGRLADANSAVELLTTNDEGRADMLATELEGLNAQRKLVTRQVFQAALAQIERESSLLEDAALVISHPSWPGGVIGIVASKLVERYARPVLLITTPEDELARGSARSIPGINISAAIAAHQDLLESFGGHPMAAGFALQKENIPLFQRALSDTVGEMIKEEQIEPTLELDGHLPLGDLSLELVSDLERLAPFGLGNPKLVLVSQNLHLEKHRSLGRSGEHLLMHLVAEGVDTYKAVWWGAGIEQLPPWLTGGKPFDLAYTVRTRDFRGVKEVQIEWIEAHPVEVDSFEVTTQPREIVIHDHRDETQPLVVLKEIFASQEMLVWAEAEARKKLSEHGVITCDRSSLSPTQGLVIWTAPPGIQELRTALKLVEPQVVYLFAVDPGMDRLEEFLKRLGGLVKRALRLMQGQVSVPLLAGGTAQREVTVKQGIEWLIAEGDIRVLSSDGSELTLESGDQVKQPELKSLTKDLSSLLSETAAFRSYYSRAEADLLINPESDT
jgi:single-stranded-DNA-specific exonuclease